MHWACVGEEGGGGWRAAQDVQIKYDRYTCNCTCMQMSNLTTSPFITINNYIAIYKYYNHAHIIIAFDLILSYSYIIRHAPSPQTCLRVNIGCHVGVADP